MINSNREFISEVFKHSNSGYIVIDDADIILATSQFVCDNCKMTRLAMSCYAATKHQYPDSDKKVARVQTKDKKQGKDRSSNKYGEMEATISLDKYNGKLMNSIWGLYNRNSPHNFKSLQNAEAMIAVEKEQGMKADPKKVGSSSFVQFSIPQFSGMIALETKFEVTKQKTTMEKLESLFTSPFF